MLHLMLLLFYFVQKRTGAFMEAACIHNLNAKGALVKPYVTAVAVEL